MAKKKCHESKTIIKLCMYICTFASQSEKVVAKLVWCYQ